MEEEHFLRKKVDVKDDNSIPYSLRSTFFLLILMSNFGASYLWYQISCSSLQLNASVLSMQHINLIPPKST